MEQENTSQDITNFTHELTPEYIKAKVEKVVSCSSGPDLICEIFDYENSKITSDDLVQRYYHTSKNTESGTFSEEQEKEQELDSVVQTEQYSIHSAEKIEEKEQGISNNNVEEFTCYYCDYGTYVKEDYERHVANIHHLPAYPNKAEIEKRGLKPQDKGWEI